MFGKGQRTLVLLAALGMIPMLSGCLLLAAGAAGAVGVAYANGDLNATLEAKPPQVVDATTKAFGQLDVVTGTSSSTALDGQVIGQTATGDQITVNVKSEGEKTSRISIRVGTFGDESLSRKILDKIKSNL